MLRVGLLNQQYNSYGQWKHLCCWRVSQRMYKMLPDDLDDGAAVLKAVKDAQVSRSGGKEKGRERNLTR